ncbi:MAG: DUF2147 domain-containing protein [Gemmatimonadetes bacterium]|nr:DUF2147 domain-containing protein [Gemmatimonadota bacterium]
MSMLRATGLLLAVALAIAPALLAAQPSPVGTWHTISDVDGKPRGIISIRVTGGELVGTIAGSLIPGEPPGKRCTLCSGARKDQPLQGMVILSGLRWDGEAWSGGEVLDPDTGKTYRATARVAPDGKSLALRGFIGVALLGRTQRWVRAP